ncbi:MAG: hypothetical protein CMD31_12780 [Flavobacteriales bacterium]|jgi:hypothetical protein|nr:hypothetical protein [Flavobacteriales bacterium]|tara:strand:+ start:36108 stop:36719 length:612 start_codon:yes stop_codon:yes gene_type:complete
MVLILLANKLLIKMLIMIFNRFKFYVLTVFLAFVIVGCPYQSEVGLTDYENAEKFEKNLLGEWVAFHENGDRDELTISKLNTKVMDVRSKKFDASGRVKEANAYRVFGTKIKDVVVYNIENKDIGFIFGKVNWESKNVFNFQYVDEKLATEKLTSDSITQQELTNFFTENITEEKMFDKSLEFYRKNSPEHEKIKVYLKKSGF